MKATGIIVLFLGIGAAVLARDAHDPSYPGLALTGTDGLSAAAISGTDGVPAIRLTGSGNVAFTGSTGWLPATGGTAAGLTVTGGTFSGNGAGLTNVPSTGGSSGTAYALTCASGSGAAVFAANGALSLSLSGTGVISFSASPSQYRYCLPELVITSTYPSANVLALQDTNAGGYSALTFRDGLGLEHGAIGIGGSATGGYFGNAVYLETSATAGTPFPINIVATSNYSSTLLSQFTGAGVNFYVPTTVNGVLSAIGASSHSLTSGGGDVLTLENTSNSGYCDIIFKTSGGANALVFGYINSGVGGSGAGTNFFDTGSVTFNFVNHGTNLLSLAPGAGLTVNLPETINGTLNAYGTGANTISAYNTGDTLILTNTNGSGYTDLVFKDSGGAARLVVGFNNAGGSPTFIDTASNTLNIVNHGTNLMALVPGTSLTVNLPEIVNGNLTGQHYLGNSATPGIAVGAGAGTGASASIAGTDSEGTITINTGTSPGASAAIATVTYSGGYTYPNGSVPVIEQTNKATAGPATYNLMQTTTAFTLTSGTAALPASTTLTFNYHTRGY